MGLLSDPQLEVRELAALTTSGLVRGADTSYAFKEELQTWSLKHARQAQAEAARERKRLRGLRNAGKDVGAGVAVEGAAPGRTLAEKHGPILGLSALVMSAPYDVPAWLPEVLLVLAGASSEPPPIRDTVTNTLADFKKTHLDTWAATRAAFSEEQWDAFMDLSLSPSYFV
jgi:proteasome activator subunit 4